MDFLQRILYLGLSIVFLIADYVTGVNHVWYMHRMCSQQLRAFGGEIHFMSNLLPHPGSHCQLTLISNGSEDTLFSLYFTSFNVSQGCVANFTMREKTAGITEGSSQRGLSETFCAPDPYRNENWLFTTNGRILTLTFSKHNDGPANMALVLKFAAFKSRHRGCTEEEEERDHMYSCRSGRCVYREVLCKNLNPCGDNSDCKNYTRKDWEEEEGGGMNYIQMIVILVVVAFLFFALIQIVLMVKNKDNNLCGKKHNEGAEFDAEFMPAPNCNGASIEVKEDRHERQPLRS